MGHNLDGLAKIVATALLLDNIQIDLAGGDVVLASKAHREIPLVVAKIEINLAAYILSASTQPQNHELVVLRTGAQDKALAVLGRGHQPRINRDIRIDLDAADSEAEGFQEL